MKKAKRAVSLLLVLAMIVAMFTVGLTQTGAAGYDGPPILGDVDGDGSVTLLDAMNLQLSLVDRQGYISGAEYNSMPHTQKEFRVANCYKDEVIDLIDVLWIQLYRVDNKAAIDAGIGKPLDELPTEPTQPATVKPTTKPTVKPTETQAPTAKPTTKPTVKPTETQAPTTKPTTKPTVKPTETQAPTAKPTVKPTTKPVGTATVTLKNNGVEYETKTFNVGETFTVYTILNTSSIDSGKISTAAGEQYYTKELLARVDALDDEDLIEDTETVFPILSQGNALGNGMDEGVLYFSGSNASKKKPYVFNTDSSKLLVTQYTVTAAGKATVETNLKTLALTDDYLIKIVDKYVTQDGYSFTYFSTFTDNGVAPTSTATTAPTIKPTETQAPTTKPTQPVTTKPTETQAPTTKPTTKPTVKPTETQAPTTKPVGTATVTLKNNGVEYETKTFNVGDTFTVYTILNTSSIDSGKISTAAGEQYYTKELLARADALDSDDLIEDVETVLPILSQASAVGNGMDEGVLYFSGANGSNKKPYVFNTDSSKLLVTQYTVTAAGKATVETNVKTLALTDGYLTRLIDKYVIQDGYSFTYFSTFTDNGVAPTSTATTAPTIKPTETQAPTTKPTQPVTTKPTETQAPTAKPTTKPTVKPTETQAPTTKPTVKPTETQAPTTKPTETQAPTTKPTETQAPTTPPEPVKGFYIVGSMNDNTINLDYLITEQDESGSYVFKGLQLKTTDQFKVAYSDNGKTISRPYYWYPSGSGNSYGLNGEIKADGTYNVYFRPKADGGDDWFHGVLYVVDASAPTAKPTETQAPTVKPTEAPTPVKGFYIVGSMTDMKINSDYLLTDKDDAGSYVFRGLKLKTTDYFKVAYTDNGKTVSRPYYWYPSGNGNNYGENGEIKADSTYNVYFRPTADGGEDWFHGVIYVEDTVAPTAKPTETQAATTAPSGKATVTLVNNGVQYESMTFNVGDTFNVYTILNTAGIDSGKISTVAGTQKYTSSVLAINDALDEEDLIEDTDTVFPILSEANVIGNAQETGKLHFSGSNANKNKPYVFNSNTSKLAVTSYKVTAAGDATVETNIKTLALKDDYLTKIVDKYVTQGDYSFTFFSTFTDNGSAPTTPATTAPTIKPTETQAPTTKPTETQAPTTKPTETQAPTTKPTETQAPTTAPEGKATVTLVNSGVQYESKTFNVGDTFTVYTILNTASIDGGKISTAAGDQSYTTSVLTMTDAIDSDGLIDDIDTVFPILSTSTAIGNCGDAGIMHFTGINGSKSNPYLFNSDTCKLAVTNYKVTAAGDATITTNIKTLALTDDYLTRVVDKYVTQNGYSFTFFSTFTDDGTAPTSSGTTAPTVKPTETQAPTTIPTETQAPETQTPTTSENNVTLYFSNNKGWNSVNVYMWSENGGESTAWPGVAPTYVGTNDYGESIYSVTVNTDQYDKVIFNGTGGQTEDVDVATAVAKGSGLYCLDEQNDLGHYLVGYYEYTEQPTSTPETQKPSTSDGEDVTLYFSNNKGWSSVNVYMWSDNGESTAWPGVAATYVGNNDYGEGIYSVTLNTAQYDKVIFNGSGGQTEDVDVAAAKAQGSGLYCLDERNELGHYLVGYYEYNQQPTQSQETQAPTTKPTTVTGEDVTLYFSNNKGWDSVNVYMWSENGGESTAWPGVAATYVGNNDYGEGIYSVTLNTAQYDKVIFNGSGGQTEDVDVAAAVAQGNGLYCLDEQNDLGHYKVGFYEYTGTTQPTTAPETQAPATQAPTTKPTTVTGEDVTLYFSNNKGWDSVNVYMWSDNGESTAWPGVAATYVGNNDYGEGIYSVTLNTAQYDKVIFNGSGGQTEDVDVAAAKAQGSGLYCLDEQNDLGHYKVGYYEYTGTAQPTQAQETQAPATQAPTTKPTTVTGEDVTLYFSNNKGWDSVNVYMWSENGGESTEWPGVAATYVGNNDYGEGIYSVTLNTAQYDSVIFNDGANSQTQDISVSEAASNGLGIYCTNNQNALGHYEIAYYEYDGTTKPTQAQETQAPETQAPTTKPTTVTGEDVTLYFSNNKGWSSVNVYMWSDGGESTAWPGVAATYVGNNDYGEGIYSVTLNTAQYDMVIFNDGANSQTQDISVSEAASNGLGMYCTNNQNELGHYEIAYYEYDGTTQPTQAQETQAPATQAPTTKPTTVTGEDVTLYFTNNKNWSSVNVYMWTDGGESNAWPGVAATYVGKNAYEEDIYSVTVNTAQYDMVIFNGSGGQTEDVDVASAAAQGCGLYCLDEQNDLGHYKVGYYDYSDVGEPQQPTSAQETQAPTESTTVSFLLTDNFGWGKAYVYAWDDNGNELNGSWPGASQAETITNDYGETQFRCVVPAGATGVILNNGSGAQTEDITDFSYTGYWMDGTKNNLGHYKVIGWN